MKCILSLLLASLLLLTGACAEAAEPDWQAVAQNQLELFAGGDFEAMRDEMTDELADALTADALKSTLDSLGAVEDWAYSDMSEEQGYHVVCFSVNQGGANYLYRFVLDADAHLAGWQIAPGASQAATNAPAADVYAEDVRLRPGEPDETKAILTLPAAEGTFPAVILVQGSGPSDKDESAYGIAPFQDVAEGLARRGVASIRYDKYTYAHADKITDVNSFTVDDEYTRDAQAALDVLLADGRIDRVFLLGHSQGGMLMPRIISKLGAEHFSGGIALAGSPLHLWEIQLHQNQAVVEGLTGAQKAQAQQVLDAELEKRDDMENWSDDERKQNTFFGISAYYQWDEMRVDAAETARANGVPVLCLQGGADWQVTPEDGAQAWQAALPEAEVLTFDGLSHMFTPVENSTGTAADYVSGSHVSEDVIDAIAQWILNTK